MSAPTRLLLFDRDPALHALASAALRRERVVVTWARDDAEARDAVRRHAYSVILIDAEQGAGFLREFRAHHRALLRRTIVVARRGAPENVFAVVPKPVDAMRLLATVRNCAARTATEAQLARALRELERVRHLLTELDLDDRVRADLHGLLGELDAQRQTLLAALGGAAF